MSFEKNNSIIIIISVIILFILMVVLLRRNNKKSSSTLSVQEKKILNVPVPPLLGTTYSTTGTTYPIFTKADDTANSASNKLEARVNNGFNYNPNSNELTAGKFTGAANAVFSSNPSADNEKLLYQSGVDTTSFIPKPSVSGFHVLTSTGELGVPTWKRFLTVLTELGAKGPTGDTGATGPPGDTSTIKGDKGDTGPKGDTSTIKGDKGDTGPKGDTGSSTSINVPFQYFVQGRGGYNYYLITDTPSVEQLGLTTLYTSSTSGESNTIFTGSTHTYKDYKTALANGFGYSGLTWNSSDETISLV